MTQEETGRKRVLFFYRWPAPITVSPFCRCKARWKQFCALQLDLDLTLDGLLQGRWKWYSSSQTSG